LKDRYNDNIEAWLVDVAKSQRPIYTQLVEDPAVVAAIRAGAINSQSGMNETQFLKLLELRLKNQSPTADMYDLPTVFDENGAYIETRWGEVDMREQTREAINTGDLQIKPSGQFSRPQDKMAIDQGALKYQTVTAEANRSYMRLLYDALLAADERLREEEYPLINQKSRREGKRNIDIKGKRFVNETGIQLRFVDWLDEMHYTENTAKRYELRIVTSELKPSQMTREAFLQMTAIKEMMGIGDGTDIEKLMRYLSGLSEQEKEIR
jgi:hypothetical protein